MNGSYLLQQPTTLHLVPDMKLKFKHWITGEEIECDDWQEVPKLLNIRYTRISQLMKGKVIQSWKLISI